MRSHYCNSATQKGAGFQPRDFYSAQAGGSVSIYASHRYLPRQKGGGFFGRVIKGSLMPIIRAVMPYLKNIAVEGADGFVSSVREGKSLREAGEDQLRKSATKVLTDMTKQVQKGAGLRKTSKKKGAKTQKQAVVHKRYTCKKKKATPLFH